MIKFVVELNQETIDLLKKITFYDSPGFRSHIFFMITSFIIHERFSIALHIHTSMLLMVVLLCSKSFTIFSSSERSMMLALILALSMSSPVNPFSST